MEFIRSQVSGGTAKIDSTASLYVIKSNVNTREITLIIGEIEYDDRVVFCQTEEAHSKKLDTYKRIFDRYKMQVNPILTFYNDARPATEIVGRFVTGPPDTMITVDGTNYRLWKISNPADITYVKNEISSVKKLYVSDGNHRFLMFNEHSHKLNAKIMVAVTDIDSVVLKSFHRVVIGPLQNDWTERLSHDFIIRPITGLAQDVLLSGSPGNLSADHTSDSEILFVLNTMDVYGITPRRRDITIPIYDIVMAHIIRDALGIAEDRVFSIPGNLDITDAQKIFDLYDRGTAIAFVPNVRMANFLRIVDSGWKLPPTSTWIEPKIIDGFLIRHFQSSHSPTKF
jgi:uncharacterized protein (DUF1015 family)